MWRVRQLCSEDGAERGCGDCKLQTARCKMRNGRVEQIDACRGIRSVGWQIEGHLPPPSPAFPRFLAQFDPARNPEPREWRRVARNCEADRRAEPKRWRRTPEGWARARPWSCDKIVVARSTVDGTLYFAASPERGWVGRCPGVDGGWVRHDPTRCPHRFPRRSWRPPLSTAPPLSEGSMSEITIMLVPGRVAGWRTRLRVCGIDGTARDNMTRSALPLRLGPWAVLTTTRLLVVVTAASLARSLCHSLTR
jgi:hypothetical protein